MIKVEYTQMWGIEHAVRAVRNPLSNWDKSDSGYQASDDRHVHIDFVIGENDLALMRKLVKAGVEQRTFARLIQVCMDITAPLYWWKEMDRYTVGKTQISTSTMHTIHKKEFELDDFSWEGMIQPDICLLKTIIKALEEDRLMYLGTKDKDIWNSMIKLLPSCYNQKRTVLMSYEVCLKIIKERSGHRLQEWHVLCDALKALPYIEEFIEVLS